jgi:hypothetical protein
LVFANVHHSAAFPVDTSIAGQVRPQEKDGWTETKTLAHLSGFIFRFFIHLVLKTFTLVARSAVHFDWAGGELVSMP